MAAAELGVRLGEDAIGVITVSRFVETDVCFAREVYI
jgi:hypothetical protein